MATTAQATIDQPTKPSNIFSGTPKNMATGLAMLIGGGLAFTMNMTDVFFANATAWTFVAWGALFLYNALLQIYQTYEVTEKVLIIDTPLRPVERHKEWDWAHLHRVELFVKRNEPKNEDVEMQIYFTPEGEIILDREDRSFEPLLAQLVIERAGLKPTNKANPSDLTKLPPQKAHYIWSKTGR